MTSSAAELVLERAASLRPDEPVPSPCISVCRMDAASGLCEGCFRTLDEIAEWGMQGDAERRVVWTRIRQRAEER